MFLTVPDAHFPIPQAFLSEGESGWSVIRKQLCVPWYIATVFITVENHQTTQTLLISHPEWLRVVLLSSEVSEVRRVQRMDYEADSGAWLSKEISEIWEEPIREDGSEPRLAVKEPDDGFTYADAWFDSSSDVPTVGPNWKILHRTPADRRA